MDTAGQGLSDSSEAKPYADRRVIAEKLQGEINGTNAAGKKAGMNCSSLEQAAHMANLGFDFVALLRISA